MSRKNKFRVYAVEWEVKKSSGATSPVFPLMASGCTRVLVSKPTGHISNERNDALDAVYDELKAKYPDEMITPICRHFEEYNTYEEAKVHADKEI